MKRNFVICSLILLLLVSLSTFLPTQDGKCLGREAPDYWPTEGWHTSTPEEQGMDSNYFEAMEEYLIDYALDEVLHASLIIHNGYIVYENYTNSDDEMTTYNLRDGAKTITSCVAGAAIREGHISSVNDYVLDYFRDWIVENNDVYKESMRIEHLLTMTSGFNTEIGNLGFGAPSWVSAFLDTPMAYEPGTVWDFFGGCTHILSAIINKTANMSMLDFATDYLFDRIGMGEIEWQVDPEGYTNGASNVWMSPRNVAKLAFLYLNGGEWDGQQILPAEYVEASTETYIEAEHGYEYGYQWWIIPEFGGYGLFGAARNRVFIIPHQNLIAVFCCGSFGGSVDYMRLMTDYILPAIIGNQTFNPLILGAAIGAIIACIVVIFLVMMKRRQK
jgi:CubicO group peptidase (beta-lactamase class C family)